MIAFIHCPAGHCGNVPRGVDQRVVYGVESICRVLAIAPSIARQAIA
jgi:hypothetical protein